MIKYKKGDRVICRSNEEEPYKIGTFIEYNNILNSPDDIPMVQFDIDKKIYTVLGITIPYSEEMLKRLDKLTASQQWELLTLIRESKSGKIFYLMHGLPGSGKSTKARELAGTQGQVFSTDDYFMFEGKYVWNRNNIGKAHLWNQRRSLEAIKAGIPIVVIDNTNTTIKELRSYIPHIKECMLRGYQVIIVEPDTVWAMDIEELLKKNTHNVPKEAIEKMKARYASNVQVEDVMFKIKK